MVSAAAGGLGRVLVGPAVSGQSDGRWWLAGPCTLGHLV